MSDFSSQSPQETSASQTTGAASNAIEPNVRSSQHRFASLFAPTPSAAHRLTQLCFLVFMILVGVQFCFYAMWALGESNFYVPKPASVEGFLPISALLAAKRFFVTGLWDAIHPAGLTILFLALLTSFLLRKSFCGYLCPIGAVSTILFRLGRKYEITHMVSPRFYLLWTIPKYLLLAFFLKITLFGLDVQGIEAFLQSPYNLVADTKMLLFFLNPDAMLIASLVVIISGSLLFPSFWCRCLCPYGALLGLFSFFSPLAIHRNKEKCIQCNRCTKACPNGITVSRLNSVRYPECVGCMECIAACPQQDCLKMAVHKKAPALPWWSIATATVMLVALFYLWARFTNHWVSALPVDMVRFFHQGIEQLSHY